MSTGDSMGGADIIRLTQNGQNLYTQGKLSEAVTEFTKAHAYAVRLTHPRTIETCSYNLAAAYAATGKGKKAVECLKTLSQGFLDTLDKAELMFLYGLAEQSNAETSKQPTEYFRYALDHLNQLQTNMHAKLLKYILQRLCDLDKKNIVQVLEYKLQLADVYSLLKMPLKRLWVLCDRANLLLRMKKKEECHKAIEDCLAGITELEGRRVASITREEEELVGSTALSVDVDLTRTSAHLVPILNEIGLLYTQMNEFDAALRCFERARKLISTLDNNAARNEAVLVQNIGAIYNFKIINNKRDVATALTYHAKAIKLYGKQHTERCQPAHCYLNKGYAESRRQSYPEAQESYILAMHKAEERNDLRTQWQAQEGLSALACLSRDLNKARQHLHQALKLVHRDEKDSTQTAACDRILGKLMLLNQLKDLARPQSRSSTEMLIRTSKSTGHRPMSSDSDLIDRKLTKSERRELKVRRSGSLRQFPKVARGLALDTPDLNEEEEEEQSGSSSGSSSSSSGSSSSSSEEEDMTTSGIRRGNAGPSKQPLTPRLSGRRPGSRMSSVKSGIHKRQSQKGLKTSLLQTLSDDEDEDDIDGDEEREKRAVYQAYKQLNQTGERDSESDSDSQQSIREKSDDHVDKERVGNHGNNRKTHPGLRQDSNISATKSLRFRDHVDSSSEDDTRDSPREVQAHVHQPSRTPASSSVGRFSVERDSEIDEATSSEDDTDEPHKAPPLPTQSPPVTPINTYEVPANQEKVVRENSLYASRESTGHYAEIELDNSKTRPKPGGLAADVALLSKQIHSGPNYFYSSDEKEESKHQSKKAKPVPEISGGETNKSLGESTVYETIRPVDPDTNRSKTSEHEEESESTGDSEDSEDSENDEDDDQRLSRAERERQMMKYHQQHEQDKDQDLQDKQSTQDNDGKSSKTCVIS